MSRSSANWLLYTPFIVVYLMWVHPSLSGSPAVDEVIDAAGLLLILIGLGIRIISREWKSSHICSGLVASGPYAVVRNPMYVGSFFVGLGMCTIIGNIPFLIGFAVIYCIVHEMVVRQEERFLIKRWPEDYAAYLKSVPAWIPSPSAFTNYLRKREPLSSLRIAVVREMNTICGTLMGAALLEAREDIVAQGMDAARTEINVFVGLAAMFFVLWALNQLKPVRRLLRGN